jgi:hypothetical protein
MATALLACGVAAAAPDSASVARVTSPSVLSMIPDCTTATFINTHFVLCYPATCTVSTFFDHYSAGDQGLAVHEWKNASCDRGGNHGDIADAVLPPGAATPCVD